MTLGGPPGAPVLADRRRFVLAGPDDPVGKQPFHAAEELPIARAARLVERCAADSRRRAGEELARLDSDLRDAGWTLATVAVCGKEPRRPLPLATVLGSHALIHAAEGELFRDLLREAAEARRLAVDTIAERDAEARCAAATRLPVEALRAHLADMGKRAGPPWQKDHKLAALVAWTLLAPLRTKR